MSPSFSTIFTRIAGSCTSKNCWFCLCHFGVTGQSYRPMPGCTHAKFSRCYRGYKGRVVSSTNSDVRMELEAQYKTVTVKREQLKGHESMAAPSGFGRPKANVAPWQMPSTRTPLHAGAATPLHGSATPLHPSATPMHPSATPMHPGRHHDALSFLLG